MNPIGSKAPDVSHAMHEFSLPTEFATSFLFQKCGCQEPCEGTFQSRSRYFILVEVLSYCHFVE